ncbi:hypothetical protein [Trinickia symbiotica]|uniref:hypothetical protein n=1 Tax=Trinickia symbiotica TaxID=863227 RepID=UPI0011AF95E6|nr:hypothetical protein [Trinickia symbiotica]
MLGSLLGPTTGLSAQEKEAQTNLVTSFVAGVAGVMGDPVTAANAAGTEGLFNRQLPEGEKRVATHLAERSAGKYTREEIEEQMRGMGVTVNDEHESGAPATLIGETPIDSGARWISGGATSDEQRLELARGLNEWASDNFDRAYSTSGDTTGAMVQLYLIKQNAPSPYAASFNENHKKARWNLVMAKRQGCDVSSYPLLPIHEFKRRLRRMKDAQSR